MRARPPRAAECLLGFFAGAELEAEILGDLAERYSEESYSKWWYWSQVLRSIPGCCSIWAQEVSRESFAKLGILVMLALVSVFFWEYRVAQVISWPIAKQVLPVSPFSAMETCKCAYLALWAVFVGLLLAPALVWGRVVRSRDRFLTVWALLIAGLCSLPVVYFSINPTRYGDSFLFRFEQLVVVWGVALAVLALGRFWILGGKKVKGCG